MTLQAADPRSLEGRHPLASMPGSMFTYATRTGRLSLTVRILAEGWYVREAMTPKRNAFAEAMERIAREFPFVGE